MARIGILALQGDVAEHAEVLHALGAEPVEVRTPAELAGVEGLILPGGESPAQSRLLQRAGLLEPIRRRALAGMPVLGTCAGLILLAREVTEGPVESLELLDVAVARNAYGRQRESFEADVWVEPLGPPPLRVAFIRAPIITRVGPGVEVLATFEGLPVLVRQGPWLAASFHPEITQEVRLHRFFLSLAEASGEGL
ncbi:MAG: pyridoxal 5'-phosphate synthase glutaminase subunit PdxT [Armatimonadota bacterium]|nr:pyridoxal 5'-phosphate synthase glutaminase subunit PdxT [Armatimonadota bacterium]MDR7438346.1 pyridoxal 5'-phosphate synthase glutaminase subunit PdxT [Armatimonadota bacterium]MDR7443332.1 pyridoxal 5'-phosphate synthase glutaminase subunit PdxT [Armatimonadota bacterium]MDR7563388.1 pyridoxal 5'-phosphate synthase glutaminase subunit PdxT [Armatimonadota bacterium]MDR7567137.1 pyridoxal 5'-phosphate synthase glutaminase subunit PdxT [Armatimonadota bacterium]